MKLAHPQLNGSQKRAPRAERYALITRILQDHPQGLQRSKLFKAIPEQDKKACSLMSMYPLRKTLTEMVDAGLLVIRNEQKHPSYPWLLVFYTLPANSGS